MTNTSFSSGFGAGVSLGSVRTMRDRTELMKKSQEDQQRQIHRQSLESAIEQASNQTAQLVKDLTPVIFTAEGEEKQNAIKSLKVGRGAIFDSTSDLLNAAVSSGIISPEEAAVKSKQIAIAGKEVDPKFAQQVTAEGAGAVSQAEAEGKLPSQLALERQRAITRETTTNQNINTRDMTVRTHGRLEEDFIGNDNRIQRLNTIRSQILENPEFLQFAGKLKSSILNKADKIGIPLTEGGKEFLVKQSQFIRDSIENINAYIKEITGAQMSEKEANRLRLAQPDPGEDVLSGDGPTKFIAKADGALKAATLAQARAAYFLEKGIVHDFSDPTREPPISLDGMKQVINDKGREQALIIKANNPDMPNDEVMEQAREIVQRRFGMIQ